MQQITMMLSHFWLVQADLQRFCLNIVKETLSHDLADTNYLSRFMKKPVFCICEQNKGTDQLHSNHAADQHLYFCYINITIPLLSESEVSNL